MIEFPFDISVLQLDRALFTLTTLALTTSPACKMVTPSMTSGFASFRGTSSPGFAVAELRGWTRLNFNPVWRCSLSFRGFVPDGACAGLLGRRLRSQ